MKTQKFGSTASTVATIMAIQKREEERKRQELAKSKINQSIPTNFLLPPIYNSGRSLKFSGTDPITTWALTSTGDKIRDSFLRAGDAKYKKVEKYSNCPSDMKQADEHLITAKCSANPSHYYQTAEDLFVKAASESPVHTTKSHAFRRAAITAKLKGDTEAAMSYWKRARSARFEAEGPGPSWKRPETDLWACKNECYDASTQVTDALKAPISAPFAIMELLLTGDAKNTHKLVAPYSAAIEEAQHIIEKKYKELEGEDSDWEWLNDRDPVSRGTSKRKGIRHHYL